MRDKIVGIIVALIVWPVYLSVGREFLAWTFAGHLYAGLTFLTMWFTYSFCIFAAYDAAVKAGRRLRIEVLVTLSPALVCGYPLDVAWNIFLGSLVF